MLSLAWKEYHRFYMKQITSDVGLEISLHLHVRKELMLNEEQRTLVRLSTAPKQVVRYVNLTLRFFSIQLFLGRRDRTLYSRVYHHPHSNSRLEKRFFPFRKNDRFGFPSH